ncbi:Glycosyl transferase [Pirellulimonas nuda]|uniref:Lipid-A-disaccharide synthase n=1 Tax=Pirellulimonas nuda TaxID=2528009 RepID=A0A518D8R6_9BACT|nr:lipid-A-disaccharide synthase [Pirellulimonas nuda]QDU87863.1 Glycosyl transferase [Pirellulimonas nuda]
MTIFFSVGEPSGDLHGANLIRSIRSRRPDARFVGYAGPRMAAAGCELHADLTKLAVMWFFHAILNLHKFFALKWRAERYFRETPPDAVVLIDYPGFNWHIARVAKKNGIPVYYYGAPQLWAWAGWRIKKMRRDVDHVLCKLPFEEAWYRERGCNATYIGHPYFDELRGQRLDGAFVAARAQQEPPLVTILPGSRSQELDWNLTGLLDAAREVARRRPDTRFAIAAFREDHAQRARELALKNQLSIEVHSGKTAELIAAAACCMAVSGSVSLELLFHAKPAVILYRISRVGFFVQRQLRRVRYITLVNLLTAKELFPKEVGVYDPANPEDAHVLMPEYLTCEDRSPQIAEHVVGWLDDQASRAALTARLEALRDAVAAGGASDTGAEYLLRTLGAPATAAAA